MIPNQWYALLKSRSVKDKKAVGIKRLGKELVVWRETNGKVVCLRNRCPHRGAALSLGRVIDGCIECPYHGFQYDAEGRCTLIPASGKDARVLKGLIVQSFPTREAYGFIWIWWGEKREVLPALPWFEELPDSLAYTATGSVECPINYVRLIENSLDLSHFPFVHHSINPGVGPVLDPYHVEMEGDVIRTWGQLRKDDSNSAKKLLGTTFKISLRFPNLILVESPKLPNLRLLGVHTPIDDENTWIVARYYQGYVRVPLLGELISWLIVQLDLNIVQKQDWQVLISQRPKQSGVGVNKLVAADKAIAMYLQHRERLIREARQKMVSMFNSQDCSSNPGFGDTEAQLELAE